MSIPEDYFQRRGHLELAITLLKDSVSCILADPQLLNEETRDEVAWLRGEVEDPPVTAEEVFEMLRIPGWSQRFADDAVRDPAQMLVRLRGVKDIIPQMAGADLGAHREMPSPNVETALEGYRERARAF